jgi:hypothetical protein
MLNFLFLIMTIAYLKNCLQISPFRKKYKKWKEACFEKLNVRHLYFSLLD